MKVRATALAVLILIIPLVVTVGLSKRSAAQVGENQVKARPGDQLFTPRKLQWAAMELQATYGSTTWTPDSPVTVTFVPQRDGRTVLCLLQYTPAVTAEVVKVTRDVEQDIFQKYVTSTGWSWLRLTFQEQLLPVPSRR